MPVSRARACASGRARGPVVQRTVQYLSVADALQRQKNIAPWECLFLRGSRQTRLGGSRHASALHGTCAAISFSTAGRPPPVLVQGLVRIHRTTEELCDPRAHVCLPPDGRGCGSNGHRAWRCALCSRCTPLAPPPTVLAFSHASEHAVMMLTRA